MIKSFMPLTLGYFCRFDRSKFENTWIDYLRLRRIESGQTEPVFPDVYDIDARDAFYKKYAFNNRFGSCGHDSVIIAYVKIETETLVRT
jgi:hypothetical protein